MADMTREEAIKIFNTVLFLGSCSCPKEEIEECLKMAISDMERVEQLEAENKRLKDGIEKVKAKIDNSRTISLTYNTALDECLSIINEHLGEVEHENEK